MSSAIYFVHRFAQYTDISHTCLALREQSHHQTLIHLSSHAENNSLGNWSKIQLTRPRHAGIIAQEHREYANDKSHQNEGDHQRLPYHCCSNPPLFLLVVEAPHSPSKNE